MRSKGSVEVLEVGAAPEEELPVWNEWFSAPSCYAVSSAAAAISDESFWYAVANQRSPHFVLSDGSLSQDQQLRFFSHVFPVAQPGAVLVLENGGSSGQARGLEALLAEVLSAKLVTGSPLTKRTDFLGYCARNIVAIEQTETALIVRKGTFELQRYTAAPLRELAESTWLLDPPGTYARVTPKIFGSEEIERKTLHMIKTHGHTDHLPPR